MIVHCEECRSKFNLDDAKIPVGGLKVRCSKCSHIFMIKKEATGKSGLMGRGPSSGSTASGSSSFDFSLFNTKNETSSIREAFKESANTPPSMSEPTPPIKEPSPEPIKWGNINLGKPAEPPPSQAAHASTPSSSFEFSRPADFGHFTEPPPHGPTPSTASAGFYSEGKGRAKQEESFRPPSQEVIVEDRGTAFRGMASPRQISSKEIISILEDKGLTDEYVVQKVHEVCEATRFVEGHEKPDWPIRVIGIDMLCKIKGLYKNDKKDDLSNKQLQIVTGINMKDIT